MPRFPAGFFEAVAGEEALKNGVHSGMPGAEPIDWAKPLEWSSGERTGLSGRWMDTVTSREVQSCAEFYRVTQDEFVSVDAGTGRILGCEDEDYPRVRNRKQ